MKRKSKETETPEKTILVGTYRKDQLEKWILPRGLYNYAIHDEDAAIRAAAPFVFELWLYAGKKNKLRFSASFDREVSAAELDTLGYPRGKGKPHAERYLLFRVEKIDESSATKNTKSAKETSREARQVREAKTSRRATEGAEETSHRGTEAQREGACPHAPPSQGSASPRLRVDNSATRPRIFVRLTDFKRSATRLAEIRRAMAELSDAKGAKPFTYLDFLPDDILSDWSDRLCVCEAGEQLDFDSILGKPFLPEIKPTRNMATRLSKVVGSEDGSLRCIDLFSGAGGLSEGLSEAGFHSLFAAEIVPTYAKTYEFNHRGAQVTTADIRTLDANEIREQLGIERGALDLIAGGPPCQGFSINAPVRSILDQRNHLFKEYLRFVDAFQPRCILIENVPGLVSFEDGKTLHAILDALAELGYGADVRILGAAYYGVPQMRWRTIIIGTRGRELPPEAFPDPICHAPIEPNFTSTFDGHSLLKIPTAEKSSKFTTVKEAIGDLPPLQNGEHGSTVKDYPMPPQCDYQRRARRGSTGIHNHEALRLSAINVKRMSYIHPGGNWTDIPDDLLPRGMQQARKSDHTKRYGRVRPDGLASTILTKCDPHWGAYIHYSQDRSFTVREAARIQSFPDHYIFLGSMAEQFAQVGNAVPPMLAQAIGVSIKSILERSV